MNKLQFALQKAEEFMRINDLTDFDTYALIKEALEQPAQLDLPQQRWSKEKEMIESWQQPAQEFLLITRIACPESNIPKPAQEPVDVARVQEDGYVEWNPDIPDLPVGTKLYTHPAPSWQGLSDDEIQNVCGISQDGNHWDLCLDIARAIESELRRKNNG